MGNDKALGRMVLWAMVGILCMGTALLSAQEREDSSLSDRLSASDPESADSTTQATPYARETHDANENAPSDSYQEDLLAEVEKRGEEANRLGLETSEFNPDPQGLQKIKEEERVRDMGYERKHELDTEKYRRYDDRFDREERYRDN